MLSGLPNELIAKVLTLLPQSEILRLSVLSKTFKQLTYNQLYSNIYILLSVLDDRTEVQANLQDLSNYKGFIGSNVTTITDFLTFSRFIIQLSEELKKFMRILKIDAVIFGDVQIAELFTQSNPLRSITMSQTSHLNELTCYHLYLNHLSQRLCNFSTMMNDVSPSKSVNYFAETFDLNRKLSFEKLSFLPVPLYLNFASVIPITAIIEEIKSVGEWQKQHPRLQIETTHFNIL